MAKRRWQWVIVPTMLVVAYAAILSQRPRSRDVLDELIAADDARRAAQRRDVAAWGELRDGHMADHYRRADESMQRARDAHWFDWGISGEELFATERGSVWRGDWQAAMREVSAGAHARDASFAWGELRSAPCFTVTWFFEHELSLLLWEGEGERAVRRTLDVLTLAADSALFMNDSLGHHRIANVVSCWTEDRCACLGRESRALLATGLRAIESRLKSTWDLRVDFAGLARWITGKSWSVEDRLRAWQHGFDPERRYLEALRRAIELAPSLEGDMKVVDERVEAANALLPDDGVDFFSWGLNGERKRRDALAALRSLRAALE